MLQNTMGEPSKSCYNLHPVTRCQVCFALSVSQFLSVSVELHSSWHTTCRGSNPGCTGKRPKADASTPEKTQKKKRAYQMSFLWRTHVHNPFIHSSIHAFPWIHPVIHSSIHPCPSIPPCDRHMGLRSAPTNGASARSSALGTGIASGSFKVIWRKHKGRSLGCKSNKYEKNATHRKQGPWILLHVFF